MKSEINITNDNSEQSDAVTRQLTVLIRQHEQARRMIIRLRAVYARYKRNKVDCDLIIKRLQQARETEQSARDDILLLSVDTVQQAATKAVYLRNVLMSDEAESERCMADGQAGSVCCSQPK